MRKLCAFTLFELVVVIAIFAIVIAIIAPAMKQRPQKSEEMVRAEMADAVRKHGPYVPTKVSDNVYRFPATHVTGVTVFDMSFQAWTKANPTVEVLSIDPDDGNDTWVTNKLVIIRKPAYPIK